MDTEESKEDEYVNTAEIVIDTLILSGIIDEKDFDKAVEITAEELLVAKILHCDVD